MRAFFASCQTSMGWRVGVVMKPRECELCGDETGACKQVAPCEARSRLIDGYRALRIERRLGRPLTLFERWRAPWAHGQLDRLALRAGCLAQGFPRKTAIRRVRFS